jgi:hypothetical protein
MKLSVRILFAILLFLLVLPVLSKEDKKDNKKEDKHKKDKKEKPKIKVFHHIHSSLDDAENLPKKEHVAKDAMKLEKTHGHQIHRMTHTDEELKTAVEKSKAGPDAGISDIENKYKHILDLAKKERQIEDGEEEQDESDFGRLKHVEKVARKHALKKHRVKTSDRMLAYMKQLLMKMNGGSIEGADRFDMKKFVTGVFGNYRLNNQVENERKRRILAIKEHMQKDHSRMQHRPNFMDEFYTPYSQGYDPFTYVPVDKMNQLKLAHPDYPKLYKEQNPTTEKVLPPPEMRLSKRAHHHIVGDGDITYSLDRSHNPKMNLPLVEPPKLPTPSSLQATNKASVPEGLFPRIWYNVKNTLF